MKVFEWEDYLPMESLEDGALYRISARNSTAGIWNADRRAFTIARTKFYSTFLFDEYHWDASPRFGTARPYEKLESPPPFSDNDEMLSYLLAWRDKTRGDGLTPDWRFE